MRLKLNERFIEIVVTDEFDNMTDDSQIWVEGFISREIMSGDKRGDNKMILYHCSCRLSDMDGETESAKKALEIFSFLKPPKIRFRHNIPNKGQVKMSEKIRHLI